MYVQGLGLMLIRYHLNKSYTHTSTRILKLLNIEGMLSHSKCCSFNYNFIALIINVLLLLLLFCYHYHYHHHNFIIIIIITVILYQAYYYFLYYPLPPHYYCFRFFVFASYFHAMFFIFCSVVFFFMYRLQQRSTGKAIYLEVMSSRTVHASTKLRHATFLEFAKRKNYVKAFSGMSWLASPILGTYHNITIT